MEITEKKIVELDGIKYKMGVGFSVVEKGDVIEVNPGELEVIISVGVIRNWEGVAIHTKSGNYYTFLPNSILNYGKKVA